MSKNQSAKRIKKQQTRKKVVAKRKAIETVAKRRVAKKTKMQTDLTKLNFESAQTYKEIAEASQAHKLTMLDESIENVKGSIAKLKKLKRSKMRLKNSGESVAEIDERIDRYKNLLWQFDSSRDLKFLSAVNVDAYKGNGKLFLERLFVAEKKLEGDKSFDYYSLILAIGKYSPEEMKLFSPIFARLIEYVIESDLDKVYYLVANFITVISSKTKPFVDKLTKIIANASDEDNIELEGDLTVLNKAFLDSKQKEIEDGTDLMSRIAERTGVTPDVAEPLKELSE